MVLDYYPFGMLLPNTNIDPADGSVIADADGYRYGFQGQEKDDEIKGEGNSYNFGARMHDPRIGRWMSVDAISKPFITPYNFTSNNPIIFIDPDGNTDYYFKGKKVGSDGEENGLVGVVNNRKVAKSIKKNR